MEGKLGPRVKNVERGGDTVTQKYLQSVGGYKQEQGERELCA